MIDFCPVFLLSSFNRSLLLPHVKQLKFLENKNQPHKGVILAPCLNTVKVKRKSS